MTTYLLDTNVLINDPTAIEFYLRKGKVAVPTSVVRELDRLKTGRDQKNTRAREAIRRIKRIIAVKSNGSQGYENVNFPICPINADYADPRLLELLKENDKEYVLVTDDVTLHIYAHANGGKFMSHEREYKNRPIQDIIELQDVVPYDEKINGNLRSNGQVSIPLDELDGYEDVVSGQYVIIDGAQLAAWYERDGVFHKFQVVNLHRKSVHGVSATDLRQACAMDLCLERRITSGVILGKAGTGKSFMPLAWGLNQVLRRESYDHEGFDQVIVIRPVTTVGENLGFLPGGADAKTKPLFEPVRDVLEAIIRKTPSMIKTRKLAENPNRAIDDFLANGYLKFETPTYMRGRNLSGKFILVDEAQNLTREDAKLIMTRAAEGTKIIFTGDPYQHDDEVHESNNGLVHVARRMAGEKGFGVVVLEKVMRGDIARAASERL